MPKPMGMYEEDARRLRFRAQAILMILCGIGGAMIACGTVWGISLFAELVRSYFV